MKLEKIMSTQIYICYPNTIFYALTAFIAAFVWDFSRISPCFQKKWLVWPKFWWMEICWGVQRGTAGHCTVQLLNNRRNRWEGTDGRMDGWTDGRMDGWTAPCAFQYILQNIPWNIPVRPKSRHLANTSLNRRKKHLVFTIRKPRTPCSEYFRKKLSFFCFSLVLGILISKAL